jgi:hypothetical protein
MGIIQYKERSGAEKKRRNYRSKFLPRKEVVEAVHKGDCLEVGA